MGMFGSTLWTEILRTIGNREKTSYWRKRLTFSLFLGTLFWELNFVPPAISCHSLRGRDKLPVAAQILSISTNWPLLVTLSGHTIHLSFASLHILDVSISLLKGCWKRGWIQILKLGWTAVICLQPGDLSGQSWHHPLSEDVLVGMTLRV